MKSKFLYISILALTSSFVACEEEYKVDVPNYTFVDNLVTYDPATANIGGEFTVVSMANFKYGIKGMQDLDEVKLRYTETGELMSWQWGYKYTGIVDDVRTYDKDTIVMGYNSTDQWKQGKWELLVCRDEQAQVIGTFDCKILKLRQEDAVVTSRVNSGVIQVYADGWLGQNVDSLRILDAATREQKISIVSPADENNSSSSAVNVGFTSNLLKSGKYILQITRWNYGMAQDLAEFDFFSFVYSDKPFSKDEAGNYYINITFDEVVTGDRYAVAYRNNTRGWNANFATTNFDADTQTYRIPIPSSHLIDGENYTVQISKKAGYNVNLGTVTLNFSDVQ